MKYITFLKTNQNLDIYNILGSYLPDIESITSLDDKNLYIGIVKDDFDFSNLTEQSINFFNIKIHTLKNVIKYINTNTPAIASAIGPSADRLSISFPEKKEKKYNSWIFNEQNNQWHAPIPEPKLSKEFIYEWNEDRLNWDIYINNMCERKYRGYVLWRAIPANKDSFYGDICSNNNYMIKSFEEVTHGKIDFMSKTISSHGLENLETDSLSRFKIVTRHEVVLDLAPHAIITYNEIDKNYIDEFSKDDSKSLWATHPQCIGSTIEELFRLIIEWGMAYIYFENREPIAIICDKILKILQMPLDVRKALLDISPQTVEKYIKNDSTLFIKDQKDPKIPDYVSHWIMDIMRLYSKRIKDQEVYIKHIPPSYDM